MINLSVDAAPSVVVVSTTDEISGGDGAIDITITSSNPYTVSWSNGSSTDDISGLVGGVYTVTITDNVTGCQIVESITVNSQVGIVEALENSVNLFPNPNYGQFEVTTGEFNITSITMIDNMGREVGVYVDINKPAYKFNVEQLEPGMYQLYIATEEGTIIRNVIIQ